jgi:hypothetical protein
MATAAALPEPHIGAAILKRDEIAEGATDNVATGWERPLMLQRPGGTFFHER